MRKAVSLILIVFLVSGFSWGRKEKKEEKTPAPQTYEAPAATEPVETPTYGQKQSWEVMDAIPVTAKEEEEKVQEAPAVVKKEIPKKKSQPSRKVPADEDQKINFPTELTSALAAGDEETRRQRMESLKRLSLALQTMRERRAVREGGAGQVSGSSVKKSSAVNEQQKTATQSSTTSF